MAASYNPLERSRFGRRIDPAANGTTAYRSEGEIIKNGPQSAVLTLTFDLSGMLAK
jgi:hypothetical protein